MRRFLVEVNYRQWEKISEALGVVVGADADFDDKLYKESIKLMQWWDDIPYRDSKEALLKLGYPESVKKKTRQNAKRKLKGKEK